MTQAPQPYDTSGQPAPPGPPPPGPKEGNGLAIAGFVLSLISLVLFCLWFIALPCAIIGLILSAMGRGKAKQTGAGGGLATAGLVLACITLAIWAILIILWVAGLYTIGSSWQQWMEEAQRQQQQQGNFWPVLRWMLP
jgi:hypothetical protein